MKKLFLLILLGLSLMTFGVYLTMPGKQSEIPILYWVTDNNPARKEQIRKFHLWQIDNGHGEEFHITTLEELERFRSRSFGPAIREAIEQGNPCGNVIYDPQTTAADLPLTVRVPACEMRLDTGNRSKIIIQGVSGVASDIIDAGTIRGTPLQFQSIGMIQDITEPAKQYGFGLDKTWPAVAPALSVPDKNGRPRQYGFPCNCSVRMLLANNTTFKTYGMDLPPQRWSLKTFETIGKEFITRANQGKAVQDVFFCADLDLQVLAWSMGGSMFNETLTAPRLDEEHFVRALKTKARWILEDRLIPTRSDLMSFATEAGYGGGKLQLFNQGNMALTYIGRYAYIQFRKFPEPLHITVCEPPNGGFPVVALAARAATVYSGSQNKPQAYLFLTYLASRSYNMQIVDDADALPPNPKYVETQAYLKPPAFTNEWGTHEDFSRAAFDIGITGEFSPFVSPSLARSILASVEDQVLSGRAMPEEACRQASLRLKLEMQRKLAEHPDLQELYRRRLKHQAEIDRRVEALRQLDALQRQDKPIPADLRTQARPIPPKWIANAYHQRYYRQLGWLDEPAGNPTTAPAGD